MLSDKARLYVALYARGGKSVMPGGEDKYHWALLVGPKSENDGSGGKRYHAKEKMVSVQGEVQSQWAYEEREISMAATSMILVRVVIGKIKDRLRLVSILESIQIRASQPGWNCVGWIQEALEILAKDGKALGTSVTDWKTIRDTVLWYVQHKEAEHRFDGRAQPGQFDNTKVPTYDLVDKRTETTP
ncbi:uncharacterized protein BCR38DRAFT_481834 [Pseudomassariella vexata]|uniref:Uncharacterized protein n=1 Tax=Pseudomassariella vexata TaxID=1141098 RepID=A0A1Y2E9Y4_9PEZI|nr:uncharacterized protein BCR38DRAFT_481834 [Pseudomassariella vexata]ORY68352.1 hypothetical protein BCR38DRAFT_481834 [Pseudomassariella vexata]